jgi:hypothetical protein
MSSNPPFEVNPQKKLQSPLGLVWTTLVFAFSIGAVWSALNAKVEAVVYKQAEYDRVYEKRYEELRRTLVEMQAEQKKSNETLIRIDERMKRISP